MSILVKLFPRLLFCELVQPMNDVAQEELVLEVQLIIEVSSEPIFLRLPVLRHDNDWSLETDNHSQDKVQEHVRIRIESFVVEQPGIQRDPEKKKSDRKADEFPTASEFRDNIGRAVRECESSRCFLVHVPRDAVTQKIVGASQSLGQRRQHFERDPRIAFHK